MSDKPIKADKSNVQISQNDFRMCSQCGEIFSKNEPHQCAPSDLELKIRKEVMDAVGKLEASLFGMQTIESTQLIKTIKDRLNLLWGE